MNVYFTKTAEKDYRAWETSNPRIVDKIDELVEDILENGL